MGRRNSSEAAAEKPAEFHSDEQRQAYLAALANEKAGYEFRLEKAVVDEDELEQRKLQNRIGQVDAEIKRAKGK